MNNPTRQTELAFLSDKLRGNGYTPQDVAEFRRLTALEVQDALQPHLPAIEAAVRRRHAAREAARAAAREAARQAGNEVYRRWLARRNTPRR